MDYVRESIVPAKFIREGDFVPYGGWVTYIVRHGTNGLFPKRYVTLTFFTGDDYVEFTTEDFMPVNIERIEERLAQAQ